MIAKYAIFPPFQMHFYAVVVFFTNARIINGSPAKGLIPSLTLPLDGGGGRSALKL